MYKKIFYMIIILCIFISAIGKSNSTKKYAFELRLADRFLTKSANIEFEKLKFSFSDNQVESNLKLISNNIKLPKDYELLLFYKQNAVGKIGAVSIIAVRKKIIINNSKIKKIILATGSENNKIMKID